jgi:hypothetical protein
MGFRGQFALHQALAADVRFGSKADVTLLNFDVRSTLESRHSSALSRCPFRANSGQEPQSSGEAVVSSEGLEVAAKQAMLTRQLIGDEAYLAGVVRI